MIPTAVEIAARGDGVSCRLTGELVIPRVIRRRGRSVEVALVAGRAMLLPGDEVRIEINVGEGCALSLIDIGGLVVYGRSQEVGDASQWHAHAALADGARLVWESLPTVITEAGHLVRSLTMALARDSTAILRETLVLGRVGERGGRLSSDTDIADCRGPVLRELLDARGDRPIAGVLGAERVMDSIIAVGDHHPLPRIAGATLLELERSGTMLRYLGAAAHLSPLRDIQLNQILNDSEAVRAH